jgi:hypothetical protein
MDLTSFRTAIELYEQRSSPYHSQFNDFWKWKIGIEQNSRAQILDHEHINDACERLLSILPGWQTYRGVDCDYRRRLPFSLSNIVDAYDQIREYNLLDFDKIPSEPLELIWHELGRVKTESGNRTADGEYFVIAVCKPLMFIWGQTLPFDSKNRDNMFIPYGASWDFEWWRQTLEGLQKDLLGNMAVASYCKEKAIQIYNSDYVVPYGRFLDIYYYVESQEGCMGGL